MPGLSESSYTLCAASDCLLARCLLNILCMMFSVLRGMRSSAQSVEDSAVSKPLRFDDYTRHELPTHDLSNFGLRRGH
jgi:hypothetical protein